MANFFLKRTISVGWLLSLFGVSQLLGCGSVPSAKKINFLHSIHRHERHDNYHWMKDPSRKNKKVLSHLRAENSYADSYFTSTKNLQQKLYGEFLSRLRAADSSYPYFFKGYYYYHRTEKGKDYKIFCRKAKTKTAPEEILLDLNAVAQGKNIHLGAFSISADQKLLAYSLDVGGEEVYTLHFKNLETGKDLPQKVQHLAGPVVWASDNKTLFFPRMNAAFRNDKIFRYNFESREETLVYEEKDELYDVTLKLSLDKKYIFLGSNGYGGDEVYFIPSKTPSVPKTLIQKRQDGLEYQVEHSGGKFYILNNWKAQNFKISSASLEQPGFANWADVVPSRAGRLILDMKILKDKLIYLTRHQGKEQAYFVGTSGGQSQEIDFKESVYHIRFMDNVDAQAKFIRLSYESPIHPPRVYDFNLENLSLDLKDKKEVPNFDEDLYQTKRIFVQGRDGAEIPVTLVFKKGFQKDGQAPALLYGYGSYGATLRAKFDPVVLSLVDRGFLFAMAHVRGGQSKGREWYEQGRLLHKKNSFFDFIDVARGLIGEKYTRSSRLVIEGRSAGGLLMGAVLNMRPDLFAAAVAVVPFVDVVSTILDPELRYSTQEYLQWGNPNQVEDYQYMLSYSPYDNVKEQSYPAIFAVGGLNDTRVNYWEPAKWVARLREKNKSDAPIVLRTQMGAGHRGSGGQLGRYRDRAEVQAFMLKALGGFQ